jgi:hypothetical protein
VEADYVPGGDETPFQRVPDRRAAGLPNVEEVHALLSLQSKLQRPRPVPHHAERVAQRQRELRHQQASG